VQAGAGPFVVAPPFVVIGLIVLAQIASVLPEALAR
jgi:hypothetical protein